MGALAKSARAHGGFDEDAELLWATKASLQGNEIVVDDGFDDVEVQRVLELSRQEHASRGSSDGGCQPASAVSGASSEAPIVLD